jgi:HSP20 family protein
MDMQSQLDRMFEDAWRPLYEGESALALDIDESETGYTVSTAIPGVDPEEIDINLHDNVLTISAETNAEEEHEGDGKRALVRERRYGKFTRSVRLATPVDADNVEANYENGVLTLEIPKSEEAKPRRIPVNTRQTLKSGE